MFSFVHCTNTDSATRFTDGSHRFAQIIAYCPVLTWIFPLVTGTTASRGLKSRTVFQLTLEMEMQHTEALLVSDDLA